MIKSSDEGGLSVRTLSKIELESERRNEIEWRGLKERERQKRKRGVSLS